MDPATQKQRYDKATCGYGRWSVGNLKPFLDVLTTNDGLKNAASCFTQEGSSTVKMNEQEFNLHAGDSVLITELTQ